MGLPAVQKDSEVPCGDGIEKALDFKGDIFTMLSQLLPSHLIDMGSKTMLQSP
jgi:hypothetical protein